MSKIKKLKGKAWVFGDILDVDYDIVSFRTAQNLTRDPRVKSEEDYRKLLGEHCMELVNPEFPKKVQKGDFIVAGENIGYGHDHETAPQSIIGCGVAAVICESTNRNFLRNAIHVGLPVVECKGIRKKVKEGDMLELDLRAGTVINLTSGEELKFPPYPEFLLEIIEAGGIYPLLKQMIPKDEMPAYTRI
jgi:3-isopropylmalate/(R)-2-methylmalate dehydratase small subunit